MPLEGGVCTEATPDEVGMKPKPDQFYFAVMTVDRELYLCASTLAERQEWLVAITSLLTHAAVMKNKVIG